MPRIAILFDLAPGNRYGDRTVAELRRAAAADDIPLELSVLHTSAAADALAYDAVLAGPCSPYANVEGVLSVIRECRERLLPFLGT